MTRTHHLRTHTSPTHAHYLYLFQQQVDISDSSIFQKMSSFRMDGPQKLCGKCSSFDRK